MDAKNFSNVKIFYNDRKLFLIFENGDYQVLVKSKNQIMAYLKDEEKNIHQIVEIKIVNPIYIKEGI